MIYTPETLFSHKYYFSEVNILIFNIRMELYPAFPGR